MVTINEKNEICEVVAPQTPTLSVQKNRYAPKPIVNTIPISELLVNYENFDSFYEKQVSDYYSNDPDDWLRGAIKEFLNDYDDPRILDLFGKNINFIKDVLKYPDTLQDNIDILHDPFFNRAFNLNKGTIVRKKLPRFWLSFTNFQQHQKVNVRRCKCQMIPNGDRKEHKHICKTCKSVSFHHGDVKNCPVWVCTNDKCKVFLQSPTRRPYRPCFTWEKCDLVGFEAMKRWVLKHLKESLERGCSVFFNFIPTTLRNYFCSQIDSDLLTWTANTTKSSKIAIPLVLCPHDSLLERQKDVVIAEFKDKFIRHRNARKYLACAMHQLSVDSWVTETRRCRESEIKEWHVQEKSILNAFAPWPIFREEPQPTKEEQKKKKKDAQTKKKLKQDIKNLMSMKFSISDDFHLEKARLENEELFDPDLVQFAYEGEEQELRKSKLKEFKKKKRNELNEIGDETLTTALKMIGNLQKSLKYDSTVKPCPVNEFSIDNGWIYRFGKCVCALNDPDRCKKIYDNVKQHIGESVNVAESDVLSPFKDYMTQMVTSYIKSDGMFKSAIVARLMAFLLSMVSSITALISNLRSSEPSTFETFIHVMSIVAILTDMVLSIVTITRLQAKGKIDVSKAELMNQEQMLNTVLKYVSQYTTINSSEIKSLVDFENLISTPLRSEIEQMKINHPLIQPKRYLPQVDYHSVLYNPIIFLQEYQTEWLQVQDRIDNCIAKAPCACGLNLAVASDLPMCEHGLNVKVHNNTKYNESLGDFEPEVYGIHEANAFIKSLYEDKNTLDIVPFIKYVVFSERYFVKCAQQGIEMTNNRTLANIHGNLSYILSILPDERSVLEVGTSVRAAILCGFMRNIAPSFAKCTELHFHEFDVEPSCEALLINPQVAMTLDFGAGINVVQSFPWDTTIAFITTLAGLGICIADTATGKTGDKSWAKKICLGSNLMTSLKTSVKDSRRLTEDLAYDFFGYQIGTAHYVKTRGDELAQELTTFVNLSNNEYALNVPKYFTFLACIEKCKEFQKSLTQSAKDLSIGETAILTTISQLLASANGKISDLKITFDSLTVRQETKFLLLFGAEGCGKTYFSTSYLIPRVCEKMGLSNMAYKYKVKGLGTPYFEQYAGQAIGITDELWKNGAYDQLNNYLNETLSQAPQNLEGAFIKNNPNLLKLLIGCANKCFFQVHEPDPSGYTRDFARALFSRGTCIKVINKTQYDSDTFMGLPRDMVKHSDTFDELMFIEYYVPGADPYDTRQIIQSLTKPPHLGKYDTCEIKEKGELKILSTPKSQRTHVHKQWYAFTPDSGSVMAFRTFSPEDLVDLSIAMIEEAHVSYVKTQRQNTIMHIRGKYTLDKNYSLEQAIRELSIKGVPEDMVRAEFKSIVPSVAQAGVNSTNHFVAFTSGPSGCGKTYTWENYIIPSIKSALPLMKYYNVKTVEDARKVKAPSIISIDDMVSRNGGKDYMDIMELLPSPSFISIRENIYWKRKKVSRMNLVQSHNNMCDAAWYLRVPQLFCTSMLGIDMMVPCKVKDGEEIYITDMEEGWFRRLGIPNYVGSYEQYCILKERDTLRNMKLFLPILLIMCMTYFTFVAPLLLIPFLYVCTFHADWIYGPHISIPYQSDDRTLLYEHVFGGQGTLVGKTNTPLDVLQLPELAFQRYKTTKNVLSDIKISESMGRVAQREADVYIEAPTIAELPPFINDGSRCISMAIHGRNIDGYRISIQNKVLEAQFPTCVSDFYLTENPTHAQVVELARKTYAKLLTASADATVCVKCGDFEAFGSNGYIRYWLSKNGSGEAWTCDLPSGKAGEENRCTFRKFKDLQEIKSFSLTTDELAAIYSGEMTRNANMSLEEMTIVWQHKTKVLSSKCYDFSSAIQKMQTSSGSEIIKQLTDAEKAYANICDSISFTVVSCMVALVSVGSIATLIYMLLKKKGHKSAKQDVVAEYFNTHSQIPVNFQYKNTSFVGTASISLSNVYDVKIHITGVQYGKDNVDCNDSSVLAQVRQLIEHQIITQCSSVTQEQLTKYQYKILMVHATSYAESQVTKVMTASVHAPIDEKVFDVNAGEVLYVTHVSLHQYNIDEDDGYQTVVFNIDIMEPEDYTDLIGKYHVTIFNDGRDPFYAFHFKKDPRWSEEYTYVYGEFLKPLGEHFMSLYEQTSAQSTDSKKSFKWKGRKAVSVIQNELRTNEVTIVADSVTSSSDKKKGKYKSRSRQLAHNINHVPPINNPVEAIEVPCDKICANRVYLQNHMTGASQYGLVLWDRYVLTNYHSFYPAEQLDEDSIVATFDAVGDDIVDSSPCTIVWTDSVNDLTLLKMTNPHVSSFKDISKFVAHESQLEHIASGYMVKHGKVDNRLWATMRVFTENVNIPYFVSSDPVQRVHKGSVVEARFTEAGLGTQQGDCGSPYIGKIRNGNDFRLFGIHMMGNPAGSSHGVVITYEMVQEMKRHIANIPQPIYIVESTNHRGTLQKTPVGLIEAKKVRDAYMDKEILDEIIESRENQIVPKQEWPLFRPNSLNYGVVEGSNLSYLGCTRNFKPSWSTSQSHFPSYFAPILEEQGIECDVFNAVCDPFMVEDPSNLIRSTTGNPSIIYSQVAKYNDPINLDPIVLDILKESIEEMKPLYLEWYGSKDHRLLTEVEVLNGLYERHDSLYGGLDGIDLKASPGFYAVTHKNAMLKSAIYERNLDWEANSTSNRNLYSYASHELGQHMAARFRSKIYLAGAGDWFVACAKDSLKDELVTAQKAKIGKTRLFVGMDDADVNFQRFVCGTFAAAVKLNHRRAPCQVGIDPYVEFHHLAKRFRKISNLSEAGDYKNWDKHIIREFISAMIQIIEYVITYHTSNIEARRMRKYLRIIELDTYNTVSNCDGIYYQKHRGIPSGLFLTAVGNSIVNDFYHVVICKLIIHEYNMQIPRHLRDTDAIPTDVEFLRTISDWADYGDDFISVVHTDFGHVINFVKKKEAFEKYLGIEYTDPQKGEDIYTLKLIEEQEFLSRKFSKRSNGIIVPSLKLKSILGMMFYTTGNQTEVVENTLQNLRNEIQYLEPEDYEKYSKLYHLMLDYWKQKHNPSSKLMYLPSYHFTLKRLTTAITSLGFEKSK
ncbi:MAG: hypothetical protein [Ixodes ricinus picorna-like virus 1]|nr:MAG: hypothetical protein [Ixodes ricinus picorna-like virus 1]